jgi:hypothetical protein
MVQDFQSGWKRMEKVRGECNPHVSIVCQRAGGCQLEPAMAKRQLSVLAQRDPT